MFDKYRSYNCLYPHRQFSLKIAIRASAATCLSRNLDCNSLQSASIPTAYSVPRQMDSRVGSCKWHLKIAHGYERDPRVVPALRDATSGANAARFVEEGAERGLARENSFG